MNAPIPYFDGPFFANGSCRRGHPEDRHSYSGEPGSHHYRTCKRCLHTRPPVLESITCHPANRHALDAQLPTARVFGEPLPAGTLILESVSVHIGTLRLRIEGEDTTVTFGAQPEVRWLRADPATGLPIGQDAFPQ